MRASELIGSIPGITMDHLHNWERQGYLAPGRIRVGKKQIRDYTEKEAHLIKAMWFHYQKGLSPRNAYRTATEVAARNTPAALSPLRDYREGQEMEERKIDSFEGIAIFELAIPLRHYFHVKMTGKEREWTLRKARSFA
jgi:DNA-binding transcriptional MerR regulator